MGINTTINVIIIFILVGMYKSQENKLTTIFVITLPKYMYMYVYLSKYKCID